MSVARHHAEWLSLVDASGPFLSLPVLLRVFPDGLDAPPAPERRALLRRAHEEWLDAEADPGTHRLWLRWVLRHVLEYDDALLLDGQSLPAQCAVTLAEHGERVVADLALVDPPGRDSAGTPRLLIQLLPSSQSLDKVLRGSRWPASPATRMMTLLLAAKTKLGLVTNGEKWMLVHAEAGETASYITFDASLWFEEPLTLQAFHSLLGARRLFGVPDDATLEALFKESGEHQQEVTDQLGAQVRRAVEVLTQTIDRINRDHGGRLLQSVPEQQLYEAAVTVMMRLVFLFAAEERRQLALMDSAVYETHYSLSTLRELLQQVADAHGNEVLQRRHDAWSRLLAAFRAVHGGVRHADMASPPYGGSLFDPDRFPFLEWLPGEDQRRQPLPVDNLTVLDLLNALQLLEVKLPGGGPAETRRLSFRALDVEQIGHVYEGLLDHTARRATGPVVSLRGSKHLEPEIDLGELERRRAEGDAGKLIEYLADETGRSAKALERDFAYRLDENDARYFATACDNDPALYERVTPFAGLIRRDAHGHPVIFPPGSIYVTEGTARRSTGTHYTPKSLTEPIVQYTLEPLVYEGPAEGWDKARWKLKTAKELLALRVCDLAMGSGAFLVQACRYLSERVVEAWNEAEKAAGGRLLITPDGELSQADPRERALPTDTEERLAIARRYVADRCLYGVDINPMAVEMAKLSLWLVTLQKDRPFTFVDHALKCGDSLLGVTKIEQVENFTLRDGPVQALFASAGLREVVEKAAEKRRALEALPSEHHEQIVEKARLNAEALAATETVRAVADLLIALELRAEDRTYESARGAEGERIRALLDAGDSKSLVASAREELRGRRPFHWAVEFPEVVASRGFGALAGNPPFLGGKRISTTLGDDYAGMLSKCYPPATKNVDLCGYFHMRSCSLLAARGCYGLVSTERILVGDSKESCLDFLAQRHGRFSRIIESAPWPGDASVTIAILHFSRTAHGPETSGEPEPFLVPLSENAGRGFVGCAIQGLGFVLEGNEVRAAHDRHEGEVVRPFLIADDLNNRVGSVPSRTIVFFGGISLREARAFPYCLSLVEKRVKPYRDTVNRKAHRESWWQYGDRRPGLYFAISQLRRVLVVGLTSKHLAFEFVGVNYVYDQTVVVVASESAADFALLSSSIHQHWALRYGANLGGTPRYNPSRCLAPFPFPTSIPNLRATGDHYHTHRRHVMVMRQEGLTKTYNRFHDPEEASPDISQLRSAHAEMDRAVAAAYGWTDLDLGHGFHETKQGIRYTISEQARRIVLDRLLELNHQRYEEEEKAGLHDKGKAKGKPRSSPKPLAPQAQLGLALDAAPPAAAPAVAAAGGVPPLDAHAAALLAALDTAYVPLGKAALVAEAKIPESAWSAAIGTLKAQGLVEQQGEKRGATYARRRG